MKNSIENCPGVSDPPLLKISPVVAEVNSRYGKLEEEPNLEEFADNLMNKYTFGEKKVNP